MLELCRCPVMELTVNGCDIIVWRLLCSYGVIDASLFLFQTDAISHMVNPNKTTSFLTQKVCFSNISLIQASD